MSREALLDEAIAKAKKAEDWQLVEWLRMARGGESAARWYSEKLRHAHITERRLMAENAKLRERVKAFLGQRDERLAAAETRCNELMDLVWDLMHCHIDLYHCETCEHAEVTPKSVTGNWDRYECRLKARARELGVI